MHLQAERNDIKSLNIKVEQKEKIMSSNYKNVGTVRMSKTGNAISIKIFDSGKFYHISRRDIELLLEDMNHCTVAHVREYEKNI